MKNNGDGVGSFDTKTEHLFGISILWIFDSSHIFCLYVTCRISLRHTCACVCYVRYIVYIHKYMIICMYTCQYFY